MPPRTAWPRTPATRPPANQVRSERRGAGRGPDKGGTDHDDQDDGHHAIGELDERVVGELGRQAMLVARRPVGAAEPRAGKADGCTGGDDRRGERREAMASRRKVAGASPRRHLLSCDASDAPTSLIVMGRCPGPQSRRGAGWPRGVGPRARRRVVAMSSDARTGPATDQARARACARRESAKRPRPIFLLIGVALAVALGIGLFSSFGGSSKSGRPGRVTPCPFLPTQARRQRHGEGDGRRRLQRQGGDPALLRQLVRAVPGRDPGPGRHRAHQPAAVADGWATIGIDGSDPPAAAMSFVHSAGVTFPVGVDATFQVTSGLFYFTGSRGGRRRGERHHQGHPLRRALDGRVRGLAARPGHVGTSPGYRYSQRKVSAAATGAATARERARPRLERTSRRAERAVEASESAAAGGAATSARPDGSWRGAHHAPEESTARGRDRWRRPG